MILVGIGRSSGPIPPTLPSTRTYLAMDLTSFCRMCNEHHVEWHLSSYGNEDCISLVASDVPVFYHYVEKLNFFYEKGSRLELNRIRAMSKEEAEELLMTMIFNNIAGVRE